MVIDHTHPVYVQKWRRAGKSKHNGAYYYSREIVKNMIPAVKTDRNWITINIPGYGYDHSIVFIHNNLHPEHYDWLGKYKDLILVCGIPETCRLVEHLGATIYLPLSVDVEEVERYRRPKTKEVAFVGRRPKRKGIVFPEGTDYIEGLHREDLLREMGRYRRVYAVGRTAIEARILGCEVLPYDPRFPDPEIWKVIDNKDAALILQAKIDEMED